MSWSVDLSGTPTNVLSALDQHAEKLKGDDRTEFEAVVPMLSDLVEFAGATDPAKYIRLVASGHASTKGLEVEHKYVSINIEPSKTATV